MIKGSKMSIESRRKISLAKKGKPAHNKGKTKKISLICNSCNSSYINYASDKSKYCGRKCFSESIKGHKYLLGRKKTLEQRQKNSIASKNNPNCQKNWFKKGNSPWRKSLLRRPMSSLEVKFDEICKKNNLPYTFVGNGKFFIERKNPDFINTNGEKVAVEVYCRRHKEIIPKINVEEWKKERTMTFEKYGWKIIYFDETQLKEDIVVQCLGRGD